MVRIAIEATGCDKGFDVVLEGARMAVEQDSDLELVLVAGNDRLPERYMLPERVHVESSENTFDAENKNSHNENSTQRAIKIHKGGEVEAAILPGDTGASVIYSIKSLRRLEGVFRPAIAAHIPYNNVLIDVGAIKDAEAKNFLQIAIMGKVYSEFYVGVKNPLIGIMNIGEESTKGSTLIRESRPLVERLRERGYNIHSKYFEPNSFDYENLNHGIVAVTDGFTGNIILKSFETALSTEYKILEEKIRNQDYFRQLFAWIGIHKPVQELKKDFDYREYATCPLLGVNGNVMICHGRSDSKTIANAIKVTKKYIECNLNKKLEEEIARYGKI